MEKWIEEQMKKPDGLKGFKKYIPDDKNSTKPYGTFCMMAVEKDDPAEKKLDMLKLAVDKLIDIFKKVDCIPVMDTMQLIVKEGLITCEDEPDWYADEKEDYKPHEPYWAMTVAMKFEGKEK